jgi:3-hydroxyisobutyrate dehydrogenase-like beta-hydroxyacid dehydrogenase
MKFQNMKMISRNKIFPAFLCHYFNVDFTFVLSIFIIHIITAMQIGFIGLGSLGTLMVRNILEKEMKLLLYNRTKEKMEEFRGKAELHDNLSSLAQSCDIVFSIVSDDKALDAICFGENGLLQNMKQGSVHVCLSTIAASTAARMNEAHRQKGIDYLTATIIGRPEAARNRNLVICYSGKTEKKDQVFDVLKNLGGSKIFEFGDDPKMAAVVKLANNFIIAAAIEALGEGFNLAEKAGVDAKAFYEMITDFLFNCPIYKNYGKIILEENYKDPGFTTQLGLKDVRLVEALADEVAAPVPFADVVRNRLLVNMNRGRKDWDWTSFVATIKEENKG